MRHAGQLPHRHDVRSHLAQRDLELPLVVALDGEALTPSRAEHGGTVVVQPKGPSHPRFMVWVRRTSVEADDRVTTEDVHLVPSLLEPRQDVVAGQLVPTEVMRWIPVREGEHPYHAPTVLARAPRRDPPALGSRPMPSAEGTAQLTRDANSHPDVRHEPLARRCV